MPTKKYKQKLLKHRICVMSRAIACISFLALTIIGVSSLVRAMSLETIANENGIPASWQAASTGEPDSITLPITYWDQKADDCNSPNRQFEWTTCNGYHTHGVLPGMVKTVLGLDGFPVPTFTDQESSWIALHDALSENVIGHDPVLPSDNFYRWFHEVPGLSKRVDGRTVTFNRASAGTYVYGGQDIYPIDDIPGLDASDIKLKDHLGNYHNFSFTAHLKFALKVDASGNEIFQFSGDDDVWVFLNNQLVLDIGGLHGPISGWFQINADGTVNTFVEKVNNLSVREGDWVECMRIRDGIYANSNCIGNFNTKIRQNFKDVAVQSVNLGLKPNDVVNLDFFYAERSTDGSNTKITINHMNWPISADSDIEAKVVGKIDTTENKLVEFNTNIKNRDPENPLDLERLAAYVQETTSQGVTEGYLPLDKTTLYYTTTPNDDSSWQPVDISPPDNTTGGFNLAMPIRMTPAGQPGDTLYFRYYGESSEYAGTMASTISYYTTLDSNAGVTYDYDEVAYTGTSKPSIETPQNPTVTIKYLYEDESEAASEYHEAYKTGDNFEVSSPEIENHTPDFDKITGTVENEDLVYIVRYKTTPIVPEPTPEEPKPTPTPIPTPGLPSIPTFPGTNLIDGSLLYLAPLGEVAFVPNTGVISDAVANLFNEDFAEVVLSQAFVMVVLLIFAGSFATYFTLRKFLMFNSATRAVTASAKKIPKMNAKTMKSTKIAKRASAKNAKNTKTATRSAETAAKRSIPCRK